MAGEKTSAPKRRRPSAKKRHIQSKKRTVGNRAFKSRMRNAMRMLKEAVARNEAITEEQVSSLYKLVDKGLKKGILKLNAVRRLKSRFASALPERFR